MMFCETGSNPRRRKGDIIGRLSMRPPACPKTVANVFFAMKTLAAATSESSESAQRRELPDKVLCCLQLATKFLIMSASTKSDSWENSIESNKSANFDDPTQNWQDVVKERGNTLDP